MLTLFARLYRTGWLLVIIGLLILYLPTYWDLANSLWQKEEHIHGPLVLVVSLYLLYRHVIEFETAKSNAAKPVNGWGAASLCLGLLLYSLGRSQDIRLFEVGSQIPVLIGVVLLMQGWRSLQKLWFPVAYLLFMVPLPGFVVDGLTGPLKQWVSVGVEYILYPLGYPIARQGVVLMIGPYQLLVADACSGLNSMFALAALGILFIYLVQRPSRLFNTLMIASIIPIALIANMIRVTALVLITYHWGDEAGQGFMHGFAGMFLFISALLGFFVLDSTLSAMIKPEAGRLS